MFTDKELLYIDSKNRSSGTDSNFTYTIPYTVTKYDYVAVLDASIPKSYYIVQSGQNSFVVRENGVDTTITLTPGNYSRKSLQASLIALLNTRVYQYSIASPSINDVDTGKFTFTVTANVDQPTFTFSSVLAERLGFLKTSYTFSANTLTSPNVINLTAENDIYIHSSICQNLHNDILQHVLATTDPTFSYISFKSHDVLAYSKKYSNIGNTYTFWITDENQINLDLNGINCSFTLMLFNLKV